MNTVTAKIPSVFHRNVDAEGKKKRVEHGRSCNNKEKNTGSTTHNPHQTAPPKPTHNPTPNDIHTPPQAPPPYPTPTQVPPPPPPPRKSPLLTQLPLPPPPPQKKKKKKNQSLWRGGVSLRSRSGHPGVGAKSGGGKGGDPPFFR